MALRLFLDNTATASPFPTTSKKLVTSTPASEVQLGPGEFDSGLPGTTDAGQWNPSSPLADTTAAAEIDNTGATLGTGRQGWLYDVDLTGKKLPAGTYSIQLRLRANQGTGTAGRMIARVSIVRGSAGTWITDANLLTTAITGEASHSTGQNGWRAQQDASRITVTSTAANFTGAIAVAGTSTAHTFTSGQRILVEFGFCDGDSATDRTWRLDYNQGSSFIDIPDLVDPISATLAASSALSGTLTGDAALSALLTATSSLSGTLNAIVPISATLAASSAINATMTARTAISALLAATSNLSGTLLAKGALNSLLAASSALTGTLTPVGGTSAISALLSATSALSGNLTNATPPVPPPTPSGGGGGGGGGGMSYWRVRRADRLERVVEKLEKVTEKECEDRRANRRKEFLGGAAVLLFTWLLKRTSGKDDD